MYHISKLIAQISTQAVTIFLTYLCLLLEGGIKSRWIFTFLYKAFPNVLQTCEIYFSHSQLKVLSAVPQSLSQKRDESEQFLVDKQKDKNKRQNGHSSQGFKG